MTDGRVPDGYGIIPDAVPFHPEEVAYLVAEAEERDGSLEGIESLLEQWIDIRRFRSRKAKSKHGKVSLQKQGVAK